jgi:hypothetical protein
MALPNQNDVLKGQFGYIKTGPFGYAITTGLACCTSMEFGFIKTGPFSVLNYQVVSPPPEPPAPSIVTEFIQVCIID